MKSTKKELEPVTEGFIQTTLEYKDMTEAWHGINEYLANNEEKVKKRGGAICGSELASYNNCFKIARAKMDKNFNFGKILGYQDKKWSKLLNNYCNYNYLDLLRNEIVERERKRSAAYNYTYHFDNVHGSGKDCLISLTFQRRRGHPRPIVYFHTRASEVTKRLPFDFLLIQRMVEYVYGKKTEVELICHVPFMYINLECFLMYVSYKGPEVLKVQKNGEHSFYQKKLLEKYNHFKDVDLESIKYKVHQRAARQVQAWAGTTSSIPDMFAKQLTLHDSVHRKENHVKKLNESLEG